MNYIVNNIESLEELRKDKNIRNSIRKIQLDLKVNNVAHYTKQINKYYFSCGCEQGAIAVFITIFIVGIIYSTTDWSILNEWWYGIIYLLLGALIGKLYGIIHKKVMFHKTVKALTRELI